MSESKSTSNSLDVYSIKFNGCRDIFPVKIIRQISKNHVDHRSEFAAVLNDLLQNSLLLQCLIADNPKRAFLRFALQHSAKFGCEYCVESGVPFHLANEESDKPFIKKIQEQKTEINEQIEFLLENNETGNIESLQSIIKNLNEAEKIAKNNNRLFHIVWPSSTNNGQLRTKEDILEIVQKIEDGDDLSPNEKKGIKGRSELLDIEHFDFVLGLPTEYMHLVPLGVVKRLLELCFSVGENRQRIIKTPLASPDLFHELMKNIKVVHEFSRRVRKLDLAVLKAQELRNILIFFFPIINQCLERKEKEIKLWEMLAFMVRACILPENEYNNVNVNLIKFCQTSFYSMYQQIFGNRNCSYSIHTFSSHLMQMRALGPLTETSAFSFEAFYSELRRAFVPGTTSVVKQMMQTVLLKRLLSNHVCKESIFLRAKDTALECNSLIYVYENNTHVIYKIKSIENDSLTCNQLGNHEIEFMCNNLKWSSVGVYRKGGLSPVDVIVNRDQVAGKVIKVDKYLLTCPNNILREK